VIGQGVASGQVPEKRQQIKRAECITFPPFIEFKHPVINLTRYETPVISKKAAFKIHKKTLRPAALL
jgi:hypothetical protein